MKTTQIGLAAAMALGATVGIAAGAAAQPEPGTGPITVAAGSVAGEPFDVSLADWDDETGQMTGLALSIVVDSTDPRLTGTLSVASTGAGERVGDGMVVILRSTYRLANDDGAWTGEGWEVEVRPGPDQPAAIREGVMMLEGEGDYEDMTAYVSVRYDGEVPKIEAVVIENTLPPKPESTTFSAE